MPSPCDRNIVRVLRLSEHMMLLADRGDRIRQDVSCGVLYGTLRDAGYRLRQLAEAEVRIHKMEGVLETAGDRNQQVRARSS